jgi:hypothetical protein
MNDTKESDLLCWTARWGMYSTHTYCTKEQEQNTVQRQKVDERFLCLLKPTAVAEQAFVILFENKSISVSYYGFSWLRVWITAHFL